MRYDPRRVQWTCTPQKLKLRAARGLEASDTKTLRGSTVRYFTKQFVSEGISRSEAIQRAKAYVDSPAYRSHFNYLRKGLSETRAKARKANSEFRRFSVTRVWRFFSTPVSCCAWKHPHRSRKSV